MPHISGIITTFVLLCLAYVTSHNVDLKQLFYQPKMVYSGTTKNYNSGQASYSKSHRQIDKQKRDIVFWREKKVGRSRFEQVHWRKATVQGDEGFSWAELLGWWISCRRSNVNLFSLGPGIDHYFLLTVLLGSVIDNSVLCESSSYWPSDSFLVRFPFISRGL